MSFSQRAGITPSVKAIQLEAIDIELRNSIWNILLIFYWNTYRSAEHERHSSFKHVEGSNLDSLAMRIWSSFFKAPLDDMQPQWLSYLETVRKIYFSFEWYKVYDFIEFVAHNGPQDRAEGFMKACNKILCDENAGYRFINGLIAPITSPAEIDELETALSKGAGYHGVKLHLETALQLLTDKKNPDPRNSMKESISAIESLAKHLTGLPKATLGDALTELEKKRSLDPVLKKSLSALYGYTNNSDGIRHAVMNNTEKLTKTDARFMLIVCSAFVNFAIDKYAD
ncbi:hypothetical protein BW686_15795 [Pseudomonas syringae]|uniref:HEPN AbiJ-N-terminal domain-containing protein n=1 Tax=Pseudomonas syringae TaxID=317 RepID=A0A244EQ10_PSESX|nr:hypothetical protein [Pseudomonas syringae]OUM06554.1 hypothetical protein BW686_15795 [Pseudomonas syringae]